MSVPQRLRCGVQRVMLVVAALGVCACSEANVALSPSEVYEELVTSTMLILTPEDRTLFVSLGSASLRSRGVLVTVGGQPAEVRSIRDGELEVRIIDSLPAATYEVVVIVNGKRYVTSPDLTVLPSVGVDGGVAAQGQDGGTGPEFDGGQLESDMSTPLTAIDIGPRQSELGMPEGAAVVDPDFDTCAIATGLYGCYPFNDDTADDQSGAGNGLMTMGTLYRDREPLPNDRALSTILGVEYDVRTPDTISATGNTHTFALSVTHPLVIDSTEVVFGADSLAMSLDFSLPFSLTYTCRLGDAEVRTRFPFRPDLSNPPWVHLACRIDEHIGGGVEISVFVDGELRETETVPDDAPELNGPFFIGQADASGGERYEGRIDDVIFSSDALSDDTICRLARRTPPCAP